mmetsp:Transcript_15301/g.24891  ORF Transcript_15301/g.24891 Transcript_15301/m.24891 type:complete len:212 (+) Transcript_15301:140-775(+)|eukprot:CAMPEP_0203773568 /NCGR_PEP_ID=MMETSP0099_2-20121227/4732_1 /ASSEMBLY_ACC=CAM_ASM_000209 /TAXON_ID=96639 /ORGANISM=" , Strain NY0313808BC1" /LENGTH=211 /DNA_ID=CAMNT_0050671417 /DNA_START=58 /DNA_END=693 /DNA_ORIENTATION=+
MDGPGEDDSTTALLGRINKGGIGLLRSCEKLAESLPVSSAKRDADFPKILGHFKNIGNQLETLAATAERELEHTVPVPTGPANTPEGIPTMLVPDLLRTKRLPEQEAEEKKVRESAEVQRLLPPKELGKAEREAEAAVRADQLRQHLFESNNKIESVIKKFNKGELRKNLKRKAGETISKLSGKKVYKRQQEGIDLFAYLYTGQFKNLKAA